MTTHGHRTRSSAAGLAILPLLLAGLACAPKPVAEESQAPKPPAAGVESAKPAAGAHHAAGHAAPAGVEGLDVVSTGDTVDLLVAEVAGDAVRLLHRRSLDGGDTWAEPVEIPHGALPPAKMHRGSDPQIAASGDRLLAAWTAKGTSDWGTGPIGTATSNDGGKTWTPAGAPADDGSTGGHGFLDVAAGAGGTFHAVWLDDRAGTGPGLRYSNTADGQSWSKNVTVDEQTCECCWNQMAVDKTTDGEELFVYYRDRGPRDLRVARSRDAGASWQDVGFPGKFGWAIEGCPHVGGAMAMQNGSLVALDWTGAVDPDGSLTGLYAATKTGDASWSKPQRLGATSARHSSLALSQGTLTAVWDEIAETPELFLSRSADRGATWTTPERIPAGERASHPLVTATGDGVLVVWTEAAESGPGKRWRSAALPASIAAIEK